MASTTSVTDLSDSNSFYLPSSTQTKSAKRRNDAEENRDWVQIGIPELLNPGKYPKATRTQQGISNTKKYTPDISNKPCKYSDSALNVRLSKKDCLGAAHKLLKDNPGWKVAVLNMANAYQPGGGFMNGSRAQEESICARTTLFPSLSKDFYPVEMPDLIYSPDILVAKGTKGQWAGPILPPKEHYFVDVISAAAVSQPRIVKNEDGRDVYGEPGEQKDMEEGILRLLEAAVDNNVNALVLGAWGCGVFRNPVREVARMIKEVTLGKDGKLPPFVWPQHGLIEVVIAILDNNKAQNFPVWNGFVEEFRERPPLPDFFRNENTEEILHTLVWPSSKLDQTLKGSLNTHLRVPNKHKIVKILGGTGDESTPTLPPNPPNPPSPGKTQKTQRPDAFSLAEPHVISDLHSDTDNPSQQPAGTISQPIIIDASISANKSKGKEQKQGTPEEESLSDYVSETEFEVS